MKNGRERFEFYLIKLEALFAQATTEKNAALWLYTNNARTPLFMQEGLAKLYAGLHNKKKFTKLKAHFKSLEDTLGAIDYYDCFAKEFIQNTAIPANITTYIQAQSREKVEHLNNILIEEKWLGDEANRIKKIRKKLDAADWLEPKEEVNNIKHFYEEAIEEIKVLMLIANKGFTEIETEVHELRRKLRWLSIYPQALQGAIQLTDSNIDNDALGKYLTPEIVNSPFNKMPDAGNNSIFLLLEKKYFLALSWVIAELGKLKDTGLRIVIITEALQQTEALSHDAALAKAFEILGDDGNAFKNILNNASAITKTYFEEQNLDKLIHAIADAK
jgi:acyl carrier protein phosphodiesterase